MWSYYDNLLIVGKIIESFILVNRKKLIDITMYDDLYLNVIHFLQINLKNCLSKLEVIKKVNKNISEEGC